MKKGTASLLWGGHQFLIHPLLLAYSWWKLYGFPYDPRLWVCFFIHDIGYFGSSTMDGGEIRGKGKWHPFRAYELLYNKYWFGPSWALFCLFHSRSILKHYGEDTEIYSKEGGYYGNTQISKLGVADKQAILYTPLWMYTKAELEEYMESEKTENKENFKSIIRNHASKFIEKYKDIAHGPEDFRLHSEVSEVQVKGTVR